MVETPYSSLDRLLHRAAFRSIETQKLIADLESSIFREDFARYSNPSPVFITSLPRSGTTALLETLASSPYFLTHTYRVMPFVLCPILWNKVSKAFQKREFKKERAHLDGMLVGFDSPEAFEETLWKVFWPEKYASNHVKLWKSSEQNSEFSSFFIDHMQKILFLYGGKENHDIRYISKNNANIARLSYLELLVPDCKIIIPFRNPWDHISSLLRQDENFSKLHAADSFAKDYMAYIGHLEFGDLCRPINFDNWLAGMNAGHISKQEFWAQYWLAAFEYIVTNKPKNAVLLDYDKLCEEPLVSLRALATAIHIPENGLDTFASRFRAPTAYKNDQVSGSSIWREKLHATHDRLKRLAIVQ